MNRVLLIVPILLASLSEPGFADTPTITLREVVDQSLGYSPNVKAGVARETEARERVRMAESEYYPHVELDAIDSSGFPGSTGALGVTGLMGSPFRSGVAAGASLTQDLFDFGQTYYDVKSYEFERRGEQQDTEIRRYDAASEALRVFFDCSLNRSEKESWQQLENDTQLIEHEVEKFVKTGQRSIVDRYLAEAQAEDARTQVADYETRETVSTGRLAIIIGDTRPFVCPSVLALGLDSGLHPALPENPYVALARLQLDAAQARLQATKTENLPRLFGVASLGYLESSHVVGKEDYSVGVGVRLPLFEVFRIDAEVARNAARVEERRFQFETSRLSLEDMNRRYDERIESAATRVRHLASELALGEKAFEVAKRRYFLLQGDLVDVRDALKNLARVKESLNRARAEELASASLKAVLNGAR